MLTRKNEETKVNRVTVKIMGEDYTIIGPDSPDYIRSMVQFFEDQVRQVQETHGEAKLSKTQLAVLVALQMTDKYQKLSMEHEKMVKLIQEAK
ncbi:MAG TPA: cell division protein ZapA [Bacillota bacterium]